MTSLEISKKAYEIHSLIEDKLSELRFEERCELSHFLYCLGSVIDLQMLLEFGIYSCENKIKNEN